MSTILDFDDPTKSTVSTASRSGQLVPAKNPTLGDNEENVAVIKTSIQREYGFGTWHAS